MLAALFGPQAFPPSQPSAAAPTLVPGQTEASLAAPSVLVPVARPCAPPVTSHHCLDICAGLRCGFAARGMRNNQTWQPQLARAGPSTVCARALLVRNCVCTWCAMLYWLAHLLPHDGLAVPFRQRQRAAGRGLSWCSCSVPAQALKEGAGEDKYYALARATATWQRLVGAQWTPAGGRGLLIAGGARARQYPAAAFWRGEGAGAPPPCQVRQGWRCLPPLEVRTHLQLRWF
jgi:hypothetical protein